ncbi:MULTISPECIES: FliO/MopB family protein [Thalassospira]|jgi:flagellar protein FliO/FliZ|uniref:FliO/MopB family protein n=1 Tax=Thalassospira TaxID=168934 RepID=UPI000C9B7DAB|nr:flagellar biosynthetic protein FliO [Thalassospira sp. GB04J01]|tara:strand:+ start:10340 stop:10726 length:387 start_codon:yes stop_codon:yes gene_type:complete
MELSAYFRFVAALIFVLGIIGVFALIARRFVPGARNINRRGIKRRLSIVEVVPVDTKRRLVLLKRDDTEHLVLLGPNGDMIVERNIGTHFTDLLDSDVTDPPETGEKDADILSATRKTIDTTDRKTPV